MTITVTVEELKAYEEACRKWWQARGLAFVDLCTPSRAPEGMSWREYETDLKPRHQVQAAFAAMEKWDAEHPFPKLIPPV